MDSEHGSGSSKHSRRDEAGTLKEGDTFGSPISPAESEHESEIRIDQEATVTEGTLGPAKKPKSTSPASSSSADSSLEDVFQMDPEIIFKFSAPPTSSHKPREDYHPIVRRDKNDVSCGASSKSEEPDNESQGATSSQVSDITHESFPQSKSPTKYPLIQLMERPGDFDPNRIPASVFASKPSTPMEWSVASNESLFSIHIGNNSFSRDHIFMLGGDVYKSGELYKSGEPYKSGELNLSGELIRFRKPSPTAKGLDIDNKSLDGGKFVVDMKNSEETKVTDESMKDVPKGNIDDQDEEKLPPLEGLNSSKVNHLSDGSGTSCKSFAFPNLTHGGMSGSRKGLPEQQPSQPSTSRKIPKAAYNMWCSCSSCFLCSWCSCSCSYCS
ncbi:unnamed protein product [Ilex paraguariensis]|uniref:Uncharacterized protein n=1 Tax=Ilex paraguariensis TaxID=185542 RepID=A0ABC8RCL0_9AQUA